PLGGDRGSPFGRIQLPKLAIEGGEDLVDDAADQPQRMALRRSLFEVDIGKQFTRAWVRTAHRFLLLLLHRNQIRAPMSFYRPSFFSGLLDRRRSVAETFSSHRQQSGRDRR